MKAFVLSSGGVDSTTCLALAVDRYGAENVISASLYYGQRHDKELKCAKNIAEYYKVRHIEEDISSVMKYAGNVCTLVKSSTKEIDLGSYEDQVKANDAGRVSTYVPFRNGLLLSIAASMADGLFPNEDVRIYYGAHADDAAGNAYADCSEEFVDAMNRAISIGTYGKITIIAPFVSSNKTEVVRVGLSLEVPYEMTWSCYVGGDKPCGKCATCLDRAAAFKNNGVEDPIYAVHKN